MGEGGDGGRGEEVCWLSIVWSTIFCLYRIVSLVLSQSRQTLKDL